MVKRRTIVPGMVLVVILASTPALFSRTSPMGQQVPPMPRIWDQGQGSWTSIGAGTSGLAIAFSRLFERSIVTLRGGLYLWSEAFSGGDIAVTIGLPLSRGRVFASVGGGLGLMIGEIDPDPKTKAVPCLAADLQISFRLTSRWALGLYAPVGAGFHKVVGGLFLCLQYGGWTH
jgi:hypothetical protein